jgi:pyrroloquinoline quinone (PQQ) biosynthesis protein C
MLRTDLDRVLAEVLADRRLLEHPFYRRWEAGELRPGELAAYAGQYRHFEAALPAVLERAAATLRAEGHDGAAALVQANLDDERGVPEPHLALFDGFLAAVGGDIDAPAGPAMAELVTGPLAAHDAVALLAAVAAYEVQASDIARSKAEGLVRHYGLGTDGTRFWDVHGTLEDGHAGWTLDALADATGAGAGDEATVRQAARRAADAWWAVLDEREAAAPAPVPA